jgi:hypothetical protein
MAKTIRQPVQWMRGNIFVTRDGIPHGMWVLQGMAYGLGTGTEKNAVRISHQDLFQSLRGSYTLLGLVGATSADEVIEKMTKDVAVTTDQWVHECELTRQQLEAFPPGRRSYFLIVPLTNASPLTWIDQTKRAGTTAVVSKLGFPDSPPTDLDYEKWASRVKALEHKIPGVFKPRRAGFKDLNWVTAHQTGRGVFASTSMDGQPAAQDHGVWVPGAFLPEPHLDEGGMSELNDSIKSRAALLRRRWLRVEEAGKPPSYQQFAAVGLTPQAGFVFPGGEFINVAAELPVDIDFCLRVTSTPAAKVKAKNRKAERNIKDQAGQRGGRDSILGASTELDKSAEALAAYQEALDATDREVEIASTIIFSTASSDPESAETLMRTLRDIYASDEWVLDIPLGGQRDLFWDCWPGSTPSKTCAEFTQITTGRNYSMGVPLTNDDLGMPHGFRIATNITTGRWSPVYMNLAGLSENDISGSFASNGELGSGKTTTLKTIASHSIDRGAQLIAVDHSDNQEWAALSKELTWSNMIDFYDPDTSVDPLKLYGPTRQGTRETLSLMTLLLGVKVTSTEGILLNRELRKIENKEIDAESLGDLRLHLDSNHINPNDRDTARRIVGLMDVFSESDYGQAFFGDLKAMSFDAQATIFCTHGLELPTAEDLASESARADMSVEKIIGRATYAYLSRVGKNIMYADDTQETLFMVSEAHHMTAVPEGEAVLRDILKTGRKHKGAVGLDTHAASELGPPELRALIPQRFVYRTRDDGLARENLAYLDPSYATEEYVDLVTKDLSPLGPDGEVPLERRGEALYRDPFNRVGKIKVLIPQDARRAKAVLTTPPKVRTAV